jgi:hypothetical protein
MLDQFSLLDLAGGRLVAVAVYFYASAENHSRDFSGPAHFPPSSFAFCAWYSASVIAG